MAGGKFLVMAPSSGTLGPTYLWAPPENCFLIKIVFSCGPGPLYQLCALEKPRGRETETVVTERGVIGIVAGNGGAVLGNAVKGVHTHTPSQTTGTHPRSPLCNLETLTLSHKHTCSARYKQSDRGRHNWANTWNRFQPKSLQLTLGKLDKVKLFLCRMTLWICGWRINEHSSGCDPLLQITDGKQEKQEKEKKSRLFSWAFKEDIQTRPSTV